HNCRADPGRRGHVRQVRDVDAPVQAMLLIEVEDFAGDLIAERSDAGRTLPLEREADVVLAEDVAEIGGDTSADAGTERADADADRRRTQVGQVKRGTVVRFTERGALGQQALLRVLEIGGYGRAGAAQRWELAGACRIG